MFGRAIFAGFALALLTACGSADQPTGDDGAVIDTEVLPVETVEPTPETEAPSDTGVEAPETDEALVQPEWDALDRMQDSCGMNAVRGLLGRVAEEIPEDRLPPVFRVLAPTDQATMDYVPRRLNVLTDEEGMVIGFKCG